MNSSLILRPGGDKGEEGGARTHANLSTVDGCIQIKPSKAFCMFVYVCTHLCVGTRVSRVLSPEPLSLQPEGQFR